MENLEVPCGGGYAIGNYYAADVETLVAELGSQQNVCPRLRVHDFSAHLFTRVQAQCSVFLQNLGNTFDFLTQIDGVIQVECQDLALAPAAHSRFALTRQR